MVTIGSYLLAFALLLAVYGLTASVSGAVLKSLSLIKSAERSVLAVLVLLTIVSACLVYAFVTRDFSVEYVYGYSNRALSLPFTIASFWAGQKGSLLLWLLILSFYSVLAVHQNRERNRLIMPWVIAVLLGVQVFFLAVLNFATNPFELLAVVPADGRGLNPILQHPAMVIHPPILFLGYVGFTIPFAFALGSMWSGKISADWIRATRGWTLWAWLTLGVGVTLGARWAYDELGWGGYWGWDPVENSSIIPWLVGTAFLHSVMIEERRGILRVWNMTLVILSFIFCVYGTFITRSGIISSVHSFAFSKIGTYFLWFLILCLVLGFGTLLARLKQLRTVNRLDSILSRESAFLLNNVLFLGMAFAIFLGTSWPILSEKITGDKVSVGAPFFNFVVPPMALLLLVLTGWGPLLSWRKTEPRSLLKNLAFSTAVFVLTFITMLAFGSRDYYAITFMSATLLVSATLVQEFWVGTRARMKGTGEGFAIALWRLIRTNGRRYGGYIVHVGVVLLFVGLICSNSFKTDTEGSLKPGESLTLGPYELIYRELTQFPTGPGKTSTTAVLDVYRNGVPYKRMNPSVDIYADWEGQPSTEVSIVSNLFEDLYVILVDWSGAGDSASFRIIIHPFVGWIWTGVGLFIVGTMLAVWPKPRPRKKED